MKTWLCFVGCVLLCSCSDPQEGGQRGDDDNQHDEDPSDSGASNGCVPRCDVHARCDESGDSPSCECDPGYEGNGRTCTDVDECEEGTHDCADDATCENRDGAYRCRCNAGFSGDGKSCESVAQCTGDTNVCDPNAACDDSGSSIDCECNAGFEGAGCGDVDECEDTSLFTCADNARCVNRFGSYDCECEQLYEGDGTTGCRTLCEAALADADRCADNGLCRVSRDAAVCDACAPGYEGDGKECSASAGACGDECDGAGSDDVEHAVCDGSGGCECAPGYEGDPGSGCEDTNECDEGDGGCGATAACTNLDGGYFCECKPGYERDGSGECVDVDECDAEVSPCHPNATCKNEDPADVTAGFTCTCDEGFRGDGSVCTDVDECADDEDACDDNATCVNRRGSFACECRAPFVGEDGAGCYCDLSGYWAMRQDVDACWEDLEIMEGSGVILVAAGATEATAWELHKLVYDGDTLKVEKQGCGSDLAPNLVSPFFMETYSSDVPVETWDEIGLLRGADVPVPNIVPGTSFVTPDEAAVVGIDLGDDPMNAIWPVTHTDVNEEGGEPPSWVDTDNDGEPGITLWPQVPSQLTNDGTDHYSYIPARAMMTPDGESLDITARAGCTSVALRVISRLEIDVESCTRMVGEMIDLGTKGRVHSCTLVDEDEWDEDISCNMDAWDSMDRCLDTDIDNLDDDQNQEQTSLVTFELVRIADVDAEEPTCLDVRDALPAFERETPDITCD